MRWDTVVGWMHRTFYSNLLVSFGTVDGSWGFPIFVRAGKWKDWRTYGRKGGMGVGVDDWQCPLLGNATANRFNPEILVYESAPQLCSKSQAGEDARDDHCCCG